MSREEMLALQSESHTKSGRVSSTHKIGFFSEGLLVPSHKYRALC